MSYEADPDPMKTMIQAFTESVKQLVARLKLLEERVGELTEGSPFAAVADSTFGADFAGERLSLSIENLHGFAGSDRIVGIIKQNRATRLARGEHTDLSDYTEKHLGSIQVADASFWSMMKVQTTSERSTVPDFNRGRVMNLEKAEPVEETEEEQTDEKEYQEFLREREKKRKRKLLSFPKKDEG